MAKIESIIIDRNASAKTRKVNDVTELELDSVQIVKGKEGKLGKGAQGK